ncbi:membrane integrity-associated transporter subunit PqiC [Massilia sp. BJB1822]|nr:membrane integrity-associated transporter subunit PqiC [Massilia sp. BJB1822]
MRTTMHKRLLPLLACAAILSGCAGSKAVHPTAFDFGPLPAISSAPAAPVVPALVVADISGPASLDSQRMQYRLLYDDAQQPRPYAYNSWSVTPLQLMTQRVKARIAQSGVKVLGTQDAASGLPLLRIEADEFSQNFSSPQQSTASISLRASLFRAHRLVDQRTFSRSTPAPSADAPGGAQALAGGTDAIAADILAWLATLPQQ